MASGQILRPICHHEIYNIFHISIEICSYYISLLIYSVEVTFQNTQVQAIFQHFQDYLLY